MSTVSRHSRLAAALVGVAAVTLSLLAPSAPPAQASNEFTVSVVFSDETGAVTPVAGAVVTVHFRNYVLPDDGSGFTIIDRTANSSGVASIPAISGTESLEVRVSARAPGGAVNGVPTTTAFWGQSLEVETADFVYLPVVGGPLTIVLHPTAEVSGAVAVTDGLPVGSGASVRLWHETLPGGDWRPVTEVGTNASGRFTASGVPAGNYRFEVSSAQTGRLLQRLFAPLTTSIDDATTVPVAAETVTDVGTVTTRPWALETERIQGADRYATAVEVSERIFDESSPAPLVMYLASGSAFPDALSASPLASMAGGGLLLTAQANLPPVVAAELERLQPLRIVIVGGTGVISRSVENHVRTMAQQWGGSVDRVAGNDRYATSRELIRDFQNRTGNALVGQPVFIASGLDFPDALSAAGAAGAAGMPLVLVGGINERALPAATASLIDSLDPPRLFVAGGWAVVSPLAINAFQGPRDLRVVRFGGADRYETSRLINEYFFFGDNAETLLATGTRFPDALAAGPLSAAFGVPLALTPPTCLNADLARSLARQGTEAAILIGGTGALSARVAAATRC